SRYWRRSSAVRSVATRRQLVSGNKSSLAIRLSGRPRKRRESYQIYDGADLSSCKKASKLLDGLRYLNAKSTAMDPENRSEAASLPSLAEIEAARERVRDAAIRTPLVRLNATDAPAEIYLKLENLQPIGSFKIRGAASAMGRLGRDELARGVLTASAGNMAQGVAW